MDDATLTALKGSIAKWEAIVAGTGVDLGGSNCPLCKMFVRINGECKGCPVMEVTGFDNCERTPYYEYDPEEPETAQAELDFLKSLLPPGVSDG